MNIAQFLDMTASRYPYKTAVICSGRKITYRDLKYRIDHLAAALQHKGIKKGTAVAILSFNSIEFVEIIFALMKIGAIGVPLNHRLTKHDIRTLLKHCEAKALFCEAALQELIPSDRESLLHIFMIGADQPSAAVPYDELFSGMLYSPACPPVAENDPSCIIYTAGTTGKPRGVLLTHGNQIWNTLNYSAALSMSFRDIELAATPLFHSSTLGRVFTYVFNGATFILCRKFNPQECLDIIQQEKVTAITQAPTMYQMMLTVCSNGTWDTRSVKRVVSGASPMTVKTKKRLKELFSEAGFFDLYGLTEAGPGVSVLTPEDFYTRIESVGRPMLSVEVKIADEDNHELSSGHVGEILCRGPNVMQEYYQDLDATGSAVQNGWLHTGDAGWVDDDGFIYIVGRKKDIIISGGTNIYPGEVEEVLTHHPAVEDAAVIGVDDELWGEKVVAVVVLQKYMVCTEQQIVGFCREHLAGFKCPHSVIFSEQLPRNAAQKVMKEELKRLVPVEQLD